MPNVQDKKIEYLTKRREYINKLRRNATIYQIVALILLIAGLVISFAMKFNSFENTILAIMSLIFLFFGIAFEITAVIYFNKAKKHLSGQTVNASTNPNDWQNK